ncbi:MAG: PH domain-containing protein [Lachnospiraceae bacterium]|nr:PH domain-containing protein [Lachnospiraceae bacterium]
MEKEKREYQEKKRILFLGLPWTFTNYTIGEDLLTVKKGFLKTVEDDCYMYKIQDVKMTTTLMERIFGLSTVICYTGDTTDPQISLTHIKHAREIKGFILEASELARQKKRTLNTLDIGTIETEDF